MNEIRYQDILEMNRYWIFYKDLEKGKRAIDLDACANSFERTTGFEIGEDGLRCVGYRTAAGKGGAYELFTIGHLRIRCGGLMTLFKEDAWLKLERHLNSCGYKTIEK